MISNMAVLPLAKSTARAQIEKVQPTLRDERRNENTRHSGSAQGLELCAFVRWHGTWPDSWQLAFCSRALDLYGRASQSDTSSTPSAISSIVVALRKDWHSHCTSTCRENAYDASRTGEGVQGRLNQPTNNSTQEVTQWKQLDC